MKRGRYNRAFLHITTMAVLTLGVIITPILADTYPIFGPKQNTIAHASASSDQQSIAIDDNVFQTAVSDKPRSEIISYTVEKGDTLSTIAQKFGISTNTIRWQNDLTSDDLTVGDQLKILPVSGVSYKVASGDTVYTIAKKFNANAQAIVDFPFNDFANPETFALIAGQMLIVPDGVPPAQQSTAPSQPQYIAQAPSQISFTGDGFNWPIQGLITQGFSWYHNGIDIAGPIGTPIYAAKAGVIAEAACGYDYGYGCHVLINHGDGWATMYGHMVSQPVVSVGQSVSGGQLIGYRGSTGRSTGPHTHFEIRSPHGNLNPLSYLP